MHHQTCRLDSSFVPDPSAWETRWKGVWRWQTPGWQSASLRSVCLWKTSRRRCGVRRGKRKRWRSKGALVNVRAITHLQNMLAYVWWSRISGSCLEMQGNKSWFTWTSLSHSFSQVNSVCDNKRESVNNWISTRELESLKSRGCVDLLNGWLDCRMEVSPGWIRLQLL